VLSAALFDRFSSRGEADFGDKILSAMRKQFGGHVEQRAEQPATQTATQTGPARGGKQ
jgi:6-phosphogluconate dehydrogenase